MYVSLNMKRTLLFLIAMVLVSLVSWFIGYKSSIFKSQTKESSQVVLQEIKKVAKLVTTEAHFAEIYDYTHSYANWPFEKKALVKVKAKALVGYDLENSTITIDETNQRIIIDNLVDPSLLALDHELAYYDLKEGFFNTFSAQDLTKINEDAKQFIEQKVMQSDVIQTSEEQKQLFIELLSTSLQKMGWTLEFKESSLLN
jgi:hypothetical protein